VVGGSGGGGGGGGGGGKSMGAVPYRQIFSSSAPAAACTWRY